MLSQSLFARALNVLMAVILLLGLIFPVGRIVTHPNTPAPLNNPDNLANPPHNITASDIREQALAAAAGNLIDQELSASGAVGVSPFASGNNRFAGPQEAKQNPHPPIPALPTAPNPLNTLPLSQPSPYTLSSVDNLAEIENALAKNQTQTTTTPTPTQTRYATKTPAASPTPSATPIASPTPTQTRYATKTPAPSRTPTPTATTTAPPIPTQTATPSPTWTATPTATPPDQLIVYPDQGGVLVSQDNRLALEIPAGAVNSATTITYLPLPSQPAPGYASTDIFFELNATDANGNPITQFNVDLTAIIDFSLIDLGNIDPSTLFIGFVDEQGHWTPLLSTVDLQAKTVTATTNHFTPFALLAPTISNNAFLLAPAIPSMPSEPPLGSFYGFATMFYYDGGPITLSSTIDGLGFLDTDDAVYIRVQRSDGTWRDFYHDYTLPGPGITPIPPTEVTYLFLPGNNLIYIDLIDLLTPVRGTSPYYLVSGVGNGDSTPPVMQFVEIWPDGRGNLSVMVYIADDSGSLATYEITGGPGQLSLPLTPTPQFGPNIYAATFSNIPNNQIVSFTVTASDFAGNSASLSGNSRSPLSRDYGLACIDPCYGYDSAVGNPVIPGTGNKVEERPIVSVLGPGQADIDLTITYNGLNSQVGAVGQGWSLPYQMKLTERANLLLVGAEVIYPDGRLVLFSDNGDGTYTSQTPDIHDQLEKQGDGYVLTMKTLEEYEFDSTGRLTAQRDRNGNEISFIYSGDQLTRIENSAGRYVDLTYTSGFITTIDAPEGKHYELGYTGTRLTSFTDARDGTWTFEYEERYIGTLLDVNGQPYEAYDYYLTGIITPKGHYKNQQIYDERGRVIEQWVGEREHRLFAYDEEARTTTVTDAFGNVTIYHYDEQRRLVQLEQANGTNEFYAYDDDFNRTLYRDQLGREWTYTYDEDGNRLSENGPLGWHREWDYNDLNLVTRAEDALGRETFYDYDAQGNLVEITNPAGHTSTIQYDSRGLPTTITDFNGNPTTNTYDPTTGDLLSTTNGAGDTINYTYDAAGRITTMTNGRGFTYLYTYDGNDNLTRIDGPMGFKVEYSYDANNNLETETDPLNGITTYRYDTSENMVEVENQLHFITRYTYDEMNNLVTMEDAEGNLWIYEYDAVFNQTAVHGPEDTHTLYTYNAVNQIVDEIRCQDGPACLQNQVTHLVYDDLDRVTAVIENYKPSQPETADTNVTTQYQYDLVGNLTQLTDANDNQTYYEYDALNRLVRQEDAAHQVTTYEYDSMGNLVRLVNPRNFPTTFTYDAANRLQSRTDAKGNVWEYTYDGNGNLINETDPLGVITHYTYDDLDQPHELIQNYMPGADPAAEINVTTTLVHDNAGNLRFATDPRGYTTEHQYDAAFRHIRTIDPLTGETVYAYDDINNLTSVTDANDHETTTSYDGLSRPITITRPEHDTTTFTYDRLGNVITITNGRNFDTHFFYDGMNRLVLKIDALNGEWTYTYDPMGNLISETDANGHTTTYTHDAVYRLTSTLSHIGQLTSYVYDEMGNLVEMVDAEGRVTTYEYDEVDNLIAEHAPEDTHTFYSYNNRYDLTDITRCLSGLVNGFCDLNQVEHYDFDPLRRPTSRIQNYLPQLPDSADTNVTTGYVYDASSNLVELIDANGNPTSYQYDALNRLVRQENAENEVTQYEYDPVGNLIRLINPRNFATTYTYDSNNRLITTTDAQPATTLYAYDEMDNLTDQTDPHGVVTHYEYDALNRPVTHIQNYLPGGPHTSDTNVTTTFGYDPVGNLRFVYDPRGTYVTEHQYDGVNRRILTIDNENGLTHYGYDLVNNLVSVIDGNNHETTFDFDDLNRQIRLTNPEGHHVDFAYDRLGNLLLLTDARGHNTSFIYDGMNRPIIKIDALNGQWLYSYDPMGNVLQEIDANGHTNDTYTYDKVYRVLSITDAEGFSDQFTYDPNGNRLTWTDGNGHTTTSTYDEVDRQSSQTNAELETTQYTYDLLGNQTRLIEADGIVTRYDYDPLYRLIVVNQNDRPGQPESADVNVDTHYTYDEVGNLLSILDGNEHLTRFFYNGMNWLIHEIDADDFTWEYTYDPVGNRLTRLDANGDLTHYSYYPDNQLQHISYELDGTTVDFTYDENNNRLTMVDHLGTTTWVYDPLNRITDKTDPFGRHLGYGYDAVGNRTSLTYADGRILTQSYYDNDWLLTVTDPEGNVTAYQRDGVGLSVHISNPNDTESTASYDKTNRLLNLVNQETNGDIISSCSYTYNDVGHRTQMVAEYSWRNPAVVISDYTYDGLRRLVRDETSEGVWTNYTYDRVGNRLMLETNDDSLSPNPFDEQTLLYSYSDTNRLLTIIGDTHPGQPATKRQDKVGQAIYAFRHEVAAQRGNHIQESAADTLLQMADDLIAQLEHNPPPRQTETGQLIEAIRLQVMSYRTQGMIDSDGVANSLLVKLNLGDAANNGNSGDLQTQTFTYDPNGNRINKEFPGPQGPQVQGTDYTYDPENRLIEALDYHGNEQGNRVEGAITTLEYDGDGRRLSSTYDPNEGGGGDKRVEYVFDGLDPVAEYQMWNPQYSNFYRGELGRITTMHNFPSGTAGQMYWYHYDGLGSVSGLTKQQGQSHHNYRYHPFGQIEMPPGNFTDPHNHYTFTGQSWDENLGLYEFFARKYDPITGVWLTQDTYRGESSDPTSLYRYQYVSNSPINFWDRYGFNTEPIDDSEWFNKEVVKNFSNVKTLSSFSDQLYSYFPVLGGNMKVATFFYFAWNTAPKNVAGKTFPWGSWDYKITRYGKNGTCPVDEEQVIVINGYESDTAGPANYLFGANLNALEVPKKIATLISDLDQGFKAVTQPEERKNTMENFMQSVAENKWKFWNWHLDYEDDLTQVELGYDGDIFAQPSGGGSASGGGSTW